MTTKKRIARAPVNVAGRDFRPGDTIDSDVDLKANKADLEAGRIEEVEAPTDDSRKQAHVNAVMGAIEKAADAVASDKMAAARDEREKAAHDRAAAEKAPVDRTPTPDPLNIAGPAVMGSDHKLHPSGTLKDGKPVAEKSSDKPATHKSK